MALESITLSASNARRVLGDIGVNTVGAWVVQVTAIAGAGTVAVKARVTGSGVADTAGIAVPYTKEGTAVTAGTAISATGLYRIPADGLDVILEHASGTSVTLVARPVQG